MRENRPVRQIHTRTNKIRDGLSNSNKFATDVIQVLMFESLVYVFEV